MAYCGCFVPTVLFLTSRARRKSTSARAHPTGKTEQLLGGEAATHHAYVHVATHGFFAPPRPASTPQASNGSPALNLGAAGWHPGVLSGIVLAGANAGRSAETDDGVLTALELAPLDLRHADLLVLSACETGLGASAGGEGLLGLQRAAQVGGVRTVVASLWQVDDRDAQACMGRFYENLWTKNLPRLEAFRQAQLAFIRGELAQGGVARGPGKKTKRKAKTYRAPEESWAAWTLSGNWR